ncbi:helix-turn-helix domain-containing protein [Afifella marina]|uniref:Transcriptional regulator, XRE family with cupin sensor n=1 Tax=Afifella marina DSM 2698 TaxID=1120955 RepID=A0A1G5M8E8_AFIMA|nr:XRE family transcriptional regulator [Afifella marina]MBK1622832.1 XRE family transcriptional regulator [Afifella marina DSM 2698]MBK1625827.1 XRE family transcriptional regulator [Afifella marina]MBK5917649.1 XRE family transcriptional regulator [Afifella marina]RAI23573.1 XRE family transcriptional regulator [Afifella marina DSM 2698]SCZ21376.1 transcriptional regulator, XRE family with cupin sensor [Afifella marina DSM 2698]
MTEEKIRINLKAVRARAGLSLAQAAELTGVSKAMLGQIERGESSPTIATLWKLAKGFQLPLTAFIEDLIETTGTFAPAQTRSVRFQGSIGFHTVFPFDPVFGSETFLMTLQPGQVHQSNPHDTGVVEDVFVTRGAMEVLIAGEWKSCRYGDAFRFPADQPHGYRNLSAEIAHFHNTIHYPKTALFETTDQNDGSDEEA